MRLLVINRKTRWRLGPFGILLFTLFFLSYIPIVAYADGGDGTGSANGVMKPLGLVSITLGDGTNVINAQTIPLQPKFTLHFDKNVVYLIYWEKNTHCFHLYDDNNKELKINLTKIDDTVDFSKRQYIWLEPAEALSPGTNYKLYIAPDLLAKNGGSTLGMTTDNQGVNINFKTAGTKTVVSSGVVSSAVAAPDAAAAPSGPAPAAATSGVTAVVPAAASAQNAAPAAAPAVSENKVVDTTTADNASNSDTVTGNSMTTTKPKAESDANQNNQGAETMPTDTNKLAAAQFAANEQTRREQNYLAAIAVMILVVWIGAEVVRRKRKRS